MFLHSLFLALFISSYSWIYEFCSVLMKRDNCFTFKCRSVKVSFFFLASYDSFILLPTIWNFIVLAQQKSSTWQQITPWSCLLLRCWVIKFTFCGPASFQKLPLGSSTMDLGHSRVHLFVLHNFSVPDSADDFK